MKEKVMSEEVNSVNEINRSNEKILEEKITNKILNSLKLQKRIGFSNGAYIDLCFDGKIITSVLLNQHDLSIF